MIICSLFVSPATGTKFLPSSARFEDMDCGVTRCWAAEIDLFRKFPRLIYTKIAVER